MLANFPITLFPIAITAAQGVRTVQFDSLTGG